MSEPEEQKLARRDDLVVGRTFADLIVMSKTGPKLDAACARLVDWSVERVVAAKERIVTFFQRVDAELERCNVQPQAIPERVAIEIVECVAREDRGEIKDLWVALMVGAAKGANVDAFYIDIVRKLDGTSAKMLWDLARWRAQAIREITTPDLSEREEPVDDESLRQMLLWQQHDLIVNKKLLGEYSEKEGRETAIARLEALGLVRQYPRLLVTDAGYFLLFIIHDL